MATARSAQAVRSILGDLPFFMPIVEQNGACVTDLASGKHLIEQTLEPALASDVLRVFESFRVDAILACALPEGDRLFFDTLTNDGTRWYIQEKRLAKDSRLAEARDLWARALAGVLSVTTLTPAETARALADALRATFGARVQIRVGANSYALGFWELSVLSSAATKAAGILMLRKLLGLEQARLVVFGDAENDLDMFQQADGRVAVRNAAPEVLALADHVVESNDEDGVIRWLIGCAPCSERGTAFR